MCAAAPDQHACPGIGDCPGIPTNSHRSPLFGDLNKLLWSHELLLVEEFGDYAMADEEAVSHKPEFPLPPANNSRSAYDKYWADLDAFLGSEGLQYPPQSAPNLNQSQWLNAPGGVNAYLDSQGAELLDNLYAEGRPYLDGAWDHQYFDKFFPQRYFTTVQTGR